jgi:hypothetical protein
MEKKKNEALNSNLRKVKKHRIGISSPPPVQRT